MIISPMHQTCCKYLSEERGSADKAGQRASADTIIQAGRSSSSEGVGNYS